MNLWSGHLIIADLHTISMNSTRLFKHIIHYAARRTHTNGEFELEQKRIG